MSALVHVTSNGMFDEIESLTRENAQLRAVIAEQKDVIEKQQDMFDEWQLHCQDLVSNVSDLSALIEKLGDALRKEAQIYVENDPEDGPPEDMAEALAELAVWRAK